jgi:protein-S-isoprenylcysteine O-methyltransferase Ste14
MNRLAIKFLFFFVPILALSLAWLGFQTISTHLIGWFLMLVGVLFSVGIFIAYIIKGNTLWNGVEGNKPIQQETGDRSFWLVVLSMIFAFYLPPVEYLFLDFSVSPTPGMIWAGLGLIIIGCFLFAYSRYVLRKWYSGHLSVHSDQVLIQNGPYRLVRHPAYLGYLLMAVGISLGYASLMGGVNLLFIMICFLYRIRIEEKLLLAHFGQAFLTYAENTKKLIPFIW